MSPHESRMIYTTSKDKGEGICTSNARWRKALTPKTKHVLDIMCLSEYSLADLNFEKESWRTKREWMKSLTNHHDEPPERRWLGEHEAWKEQDWSLAMISFEHLENEKMKLLEEITEKTWNSGREKIKHLKREFIHHDQPPEEGITSSWWNKNKNLCMFILHQPNLMTTNGLAYYLFLLKKIEERYGTHLKKVFNESPDRLENKRMKKKAWMNEETRERRKRNLEWITVWRELQQSTEEASSGMKRYENKKRR